MQAGRPGGGGVRRRQALHLGDVLPCELLGLELDSSRELDDSAIDPSVENKLSTEAASPAAPAGAGDATCGQPAAAGATAVAAPDSPAPAAEPLPAYTSLARQQLQQRLKAAIAAGTGPAPGAQLGGLLSPAAAVQHHRRPSRAAVLHGGSRQAGTAALPQLDHTKAVQQRCAAPPPANIARPAVPPLAQQTAQPPAAAHGFELPVQGRPRTAACAQQLPCLPAAQRDAAGSAALPSMQAQQAQQGVQRGPLALLLPSLTEQFAGAPGPHVSVMFKCLNSSLMLGTTSGVLYVTCHSCRHPDRTAARRRWHHPPACAALRWSQLPAGSSDCSGCAGAAACRPSRCSTQGGSVA